MCDCNESHNLSMVRAIFPYFNNRRQNNKKIEEAFLKFRNQNSKFMGMKQI